MENLAIGVSDEEGDVVDLLTQRERGDSIRSPFPMPFFFIYENLWKAFASI